MSGSGPPNRGGGGGGRGILRSRKRCNPMNEEEDEDGGRRTMNDDESSGVVIGRGVRFSTNVKTGVLEFASWRPPSSINGLGDDGGRRSHFAGTGDDDEGRRGGDGGDYDSDDDDAEDAMLASGDAFSSSVVVGANSSARKDRHQNHSDDDKDENSAFRNPAEIEEARRERGRVRRTGGGDGAEGIDESAIEEIENDDYDGARRGRDNRHRRDRLDENNDDGYDGGGLSLITDKSADPDAYESNASGNASCPVEPFNMDAERDGGMGYFDGDTYVFRRNSKPIDGEDDAWLDGTPGDGDGDGDDEVDGGGGGSAGVGGLDSTSVWRPKSRATLTDDVVGGGRGKGKTKFVTDDDTLVDLGRRLANLLSNDDETAMSALARHGAYVRDLRMKGLKATKKSKLVNRKRQGGKSSSSSSSTHHSDDAEKADDGTFDDTAADAMGHLKAETERTREMVEELTELADALLFGGETEAYELTRRDWIHRFKLDDVFHMTPSADDSGMTQASRASMKRKGYFDDAMSIDEGGNSESANAKGAPLPVHRTEEVMWEYKGNEDGVIHGPYTSRQMLDWTSCGYFVGESSVDIRRVSGRDAAGVASTPGNGAIDGNDAEDDAKADVDDLMADLLEDDDSDNADTIKKESCVADAEKSVESSWSRSDRVDFGLYL